MIASRTLDCIKAYKKNILIIPPPPQCCNLGCHFYDFFLSIQKKMPIHIYSFGCPK